MSGQYWVAPMPPFHTADGAAVTASATLTELTPNTTTNPQIVVPAPLLGEFPGKRLRFDAWGHYTTTATQGTITWDLRMGAAGAIGSMTSIAATSALTWVASQTNRMWHVEGVVSIRSIGSAGTAVGFMDVGNVVSGTTDVAGSVAGTTAGSTAAIDTTAARAIALGVTISVASQSITCRYFGVQLVN
jgi:hypothetical protein